MTKAILLDLFFAEKHAVRAVEVFDNTAASVADELRVVATDEFALDIDFVVRRASDNDPPLGKAVFCHQFAIGENLDACDGPTRCLLLLHIQ